HRVVQAQAGQDFAGVLQALAQEAGERIGGYGFAAEISLVLIAAEPAQEVQLLLRLHALGDHLQMQAVRQRHDGAHDLRIIAAGGDFLDEGVIDLELVERQAPQVAQARVAGAEVIDRNAHPESGQAAEDFDRSLRVVHNRALGQLQLEEAGLEACLMQRATDYFEEIPLAELLRRQVHGHSYRADAGHLPCSRLPARFAQHPFPNRDDQAGLFGHGDEAAGRDETALRVAPANQRLGAVDTAGLHVNLRLVVQLELIP